MEKPYLGLGLSILSVSFAAIFIVSCETHPMNIALYRMLFTILFLSPMIVAKKSVREEIRSLPRQTWIVMIGIGLILSLHFSFWITSLSLTSVASSTILVTAHPVLVAPIAFVLLHEKVSKVNVAGILISLIGVVLLVVGNYGWSAIQLDSLEGNVLAILGGVMAGLYIIGGRKVRGNVGVITYALIVYCIAAAFLFVFTLGVGVDITNVSLRDFGIIALMAFVAGIFGHTLYNWSLGYIKASVASVALLLEPIGSSLLAFILPWLNQVPSVYTISGGAVILFGVYLTSRNINDVEIFENV